MKMRLLVPIFFLSGFAALVFETLWFYQLRLSLGNSVWASGMTLTAFMAGLALGNWAVTQKPWKRFRSGPSMSPIHAYAIIEIVIGVAGLALVFALPSIQNFVLSILSSIGASPIANVVRLFIAFSLLLIPASCMGATLPLLVGGIGDSKEEFGLVLGTFYGANTFGAVAGAIAAEWILIGTLHVGGAAVVAGSANFLAAIGAFWVAKKVDVATIEVLPRPKIHPGMLAGAASGFSLLALEVIWFRYLSLYFPNHPQVFALMLAVVLIGIAAGGTVGGRISKNTDATAFLTPAFLLAAFATLFLFEIDIAESTRTPIEIILSATILMFPVSFISGILFSTIGTYIRNDVADATQASGWLTVFNTVGSALGAFLATFVLLPFVGSRWTIAMVALLYAAVGLVLWRRTSPDPKLAKFATAMFIAAAIAYPFYDPLDRFVETQSEQYSSEIIGLREGLVETGVLLEHKFLGERHHTRWVTNGYVMSATTVFARRQMKQYVYLPVALKGEMDDALLLCFGIGNTAQALAATPEVKKIDIVDISKDIFGLADLVFPTGVNPARDERTEIHIDDGRHFLATTEKKYDLITAEPPPPAIAGVVSLFTSEFFSLLKSRLKPGGIVTYWLPLYVLPNGAGMSVAKSFCDVFPDCTFWRSAGDNLIMMGVNGEITPTDDALYVKQWQDLRRQELIATGYENPYMLGATFLGDYSQFKADFVDAKPVSDFDPHRIYDSKIATDRANAVYKDWMGNDWKRARDRFLESEVIDRLFEPSLQASIGEWFDEQALSNVALAGERFPLYGLPHGKRPENFVRAIEHPMLSQPTYWMFDSDQDFVKIIRDKNPDPKTLGAAGRYHWAVASVRDAAKTKNFDEILETLSGIDPNDEEFGKPALQFRALLHGMRGESETAQKLSSEADRLEDGRLLIDGLSDWLKRSI